MKRRRDELPDLSDLTGLWDANGPIYRRDATDKPDEARMESMREEIARRIDSIPANAQTASDWDTPNKWGVSDLDLHGPYDSRGLDPEQKALAYQAVVEGRSRSDGVETLEHGHQLGGTGLESLSQADIDALDQRDRDMKQSADRMWSEFVMRFPELSQDPERVQVAIALHDDELRSYGQNPDVIRRDDPIGYVKGVAEASRHVVGSDGPDTRHAPASADDGRSTSLSYGEGSRHSASDKRDDDDGGLVAQIREIQRRSGLY
jgi:hypothetical protein